MLYGNMKQLAMLSMSIFGLMAWTDCSSEVITKNIDNASNFDELIF